MAKVTQTYNKVEQLKIPTPIVSLGKKVILQHRRSEDISTIDPILANDDISVGISFPSGDYADFFANKPMIFMYLLGNKGKSITSIQYNHGDNKSKGYFHPDNFGGALNRVSTYYGGGNSPLHELVTEWDLNPAIYNNLGDTYYFEDQIINIKQKEFYNSPSGITLPVSLPTWSTSPYIYCLKKLNSYGAPTTSGTVVTSYKQPIFFKFACIDPNNSKNVLFSEESQKIIIYPKQGYFKPQDDTYFYDFTVDYGW